MSTTEQGYPDSGHVDPGGSSISRTVSLGDGADVEVRKFSVGPMDNNVYVLISDGQALLIDAANDADRILAEVEGLDVVTILTTHGHGDHWQALDAVATATGAEVVCHQADQAMIPHQADRHVGHDDQVSFGRATVDLIHNPGHTPGSISVLLGTDHLFTGDTLFPGGPGNTFGSATAFDTIIESIETRLFDRLPDTCRIYPGHGDDTTIGAERGSLEEWRERGW